MRHDWKRKDGLALCLNCGIQVKEYRIKMGGLPKCMKQSKETSKDPDADGLVVCSKCNKMVPDTIFCIYCAVQLHPLGWDKRG